MIIGLIWTESLPNRVLLPTYLENGIVHIRFHINLSIQKEPLIWRVNGEAFCVDNLKFMGKKQKLYASNNDE